MLFPRLSPHFLPLPVSSFYSSATMQAVTASARAFAGARAQRASASRVRACRLPICQRLSGRDRFSAGPPTLLTILRRQLANQPLLLPGSAGQEAGLQGQRGVLRAG